MQNFPMARSLPDPGNDWRLAIRKVEGFENQSKSGLRGLGAAENDDFLAIRSL
jgi:hypothetical protein